MANSHVPCRNKKPTLFLRVSFAETPAKKQHWQAAPAKTASPVTQASTASVMPFNFEAVRQRIPLKPDSILSARTVTPMGSGRQQAGPTSSRLLPSSSVRDSAAAESEVSSSFGRMPGDSEHGLEERSLLGPFTVDLQSPFGTSFLDGLRRSIIPQEFHQYEVEPFVSVDPSEVDPSLLDLDSGLYLQRTWPSPETSNDPQARGNNRDRATTKPRVQVATSGSQIGLAHNLRQEKAARDINDFRQLQKW